MNEIELTGLDETHFPLAAMAAFGVLRLLTARATREGMLDDHSVNACVRMSWRELPRWTPVLHTSLAREDVILALYESAVDATSSPAWASRDNLGDLTTKELRALLELCEDMETMEGARRERSQAAQSIPVSTIRPDDGQLAAAFACEWPEVKTRKPFLTPFFTTSGQQRWCKAILETAKATVERRRAREGLPGAIEEALFGPWRYADPLSALGWDPATERQHALEAKAPTKSRPTSVAAAVWLAAESLALYPCLSGIRGCQVPCFYEDRDRRDQPVWWFFLPVWRSPLSYEAVRIIVGLPFSKLLANGGPRDQVNVRLRLRGCGIGAVFASRRVESTAGHGYYVFRPAELVWSS